MITTYITDEERKKFQRCADKEIDDLLTELNNKYGNKWLVQERTVYRRGWFGVVKKTEPYYSLMWDMGGEVQLVNFYLDGSNTSINTIVPKGYIMCYLVGMINGLTYHLTAK